MPQKFSIPTYKLRSRSHLRKMQADAKERIALNRKRLLAQQQFGAIVACFSSLSVSNSILAETSKDYVLRFCHENKIEVPVDWSFSKFNLKRNSPTTFLRGLSKNGLLTSTLRRKLLESLFEFVAQGDQLFFEREACLDDVAQFLGFSGQSYLNLKQKKLLRSKSKKGSKVSCPKSAALKQHYQTLGCSEADSELTLKQRYRALVKQFHPDSHAAVNLSEAQIAQNASRFRLIQASYEAIQLSRYGQTMQDCPSSSDLV